MSLEAVLEELKALRSEVRALKESREPSLLCELQEAARILGVSPKTIRRMVHDGQISTVHVRDKEMVPRSELLRISSPPRLVSSGAGEEQVRFDAAAALERLKALRSRRR